MCPLGYCIDYLNVVVVEVDHIQISLSVVELSIFVMILVGVVESFFVLGFIFIRREAEDSHSPEPNSPSVYEEYQYTYTKIKKSKNCGRIA